MGVREQTADAIEKRKLITEIMCLCPKGTTIGDVGWAVGYIQAADMLREEDALNRLNRMMVMGMGLPRKGEHNEL